MAQRKQSKLAFVLEEGTKKKKKDNFVFLIFCREDRERMQSHSGR